MAPELLADRPQLGFGPFHTKARQQLRPGFPGKLLEATTPGRAALVVGEVGRRQPRGDDSKPLVEGGQFAQERLERRLAQPSLLRTRRILERLQAIQNQ
jgi:hypothetical protein